MPRNRLCLASGLVALLIGGMAVQAQETPMQLKGKKDHYTGSYGARRVPVYLFSLDFPPKSFFHNILTPSQELSTGSDRFQLAVNQHFNTSRSLYRVDQPEQASFLVTIKCSGVVYCKRLDVDVQNNKREVWASYSIPGAGLLGKPDLDLTAQKLVHTLEMRLEQQE